jgi:hypothetical protein
MNRSAERSNGASERSSGALVTFYAAVVINACLMVAGCSTGELGSASDYSRGPIVQTPANFDTALRQNQAALAERKGAQDLALYNIGLILAHPSNPRRDPTKAVQSFKTVVTEHPRSMYAEQAKTWIQVLEQQQKIADERHKLAEEKRALAREREMLAQERQKLNYANEKSQQLDMEIERRRRQSLGR